jgi:arylsulfatase A-like enzyme
MVRWPGKAQPHAEVNDIVSIEDSLPTLMAAVGELFAGYTAVETLRRFSLDPAVTQGLPAA